MWREVDVMKVKKGCYTIFYVLSYESGFAVWMDR